MFCKNCGKELEEGTIFCGNCGTQIVNNGKANNFKNKFLKNKMKLGVTAVAIGLALSVGGIFFTEHPKAEMVGNTNPNVINNSKAVVYNDEIYFAQYNFKVWHNTLYKMKKDGTQISEAAPKVGTCLNIVDGWMYYSDGEDKRSFVGRMKLDGSEKTELVSSTTDNYSNVYVVGDWIYYIKSINDHNTTGSSGIWKMKLDGSKNTEIVGASKEIRKLGQFSSLNITDKYMYYIRFNTDSIDKNKPYHYSICRSDLDGKNEKVLLNNTDDKVVMSNLNVYDNWIYYCIPKDKDSEIHKMNLDGSKDSKIANGKDVNISNDGWIFYPDCVNHSLVKMKPDGSQRSEILGKDQWSGWDLNIVDNWIFYMVGDGTTCKVKMDGTQNGAA